jgi:vanillate O-demethylase ferredoxin subunit
MAARTAIREFASNDLRPQPQNGVKAVGGGSSACERIQVVVQSIHRETETVRVLKLTSYKGNVLPAVTPGAHIAVELPNHLVRNYSLTGDLSDPESYTIAVRRGTEGGGSHFMHENIAPGDRLVVSPPQNRFPLRTDAWNTLLIAGGIGITPLLPMAFSLNAIGRSFALHYCTRGPEHTAFRDTLLASGFAGRVQLHHRVDHAGGMDVRQVLQAAPAGTQVYCCGPEGLIQAVLSAARDSRGLEVHVERFVAPTGQSDRKGLETFEIEVASSGQIYRVEAGDSILDVLLDNGHDVPCSCEQGLCGTCLIEVLDGVPDHRDAVLTDEERAAGRSIAVCVSRSRSPKLKLNI